MEITRAHAANTPTLGSYQIDTGRSVVRFATRHLFGLAPVRGTFAIRSGTVEVAEPLADSAIRAEIDAGSFRTGYAARDGNVRSAGFLDTGRHPVITFSSAGTDGSAVTGTLTVRGVTRPVTLAIEHSAVAPDSFTVRAVTRIDRTSFGVTASRGLAGRYLRMTVEVRCVRS